MFQRRTLSLLAFSMVLLFHAQTDHLLCAQQPNNPPTLRETLATGLKARLPREFQFIDRVVNMVQNNQLPLPLVQSTFLWARKKARFNRNPFWYFERGLRLRAAQVGIIVPPA